MSAAAAPRTRNLEFPRGPFLLRASVNAERITFGLYPKAGQGQVAFATATPEELEVKSSAAIAQVIWLGNAAFEVSADELNKVIGAVRAFHSDPIRGLEAPEAVTS